MELSGRMQLSEIIRYIEPRETILGSPEAFVTELAIDSRKVTAPEHTLFFAIETEKGTCISPPCIRWGFATL